MEPLDPQDVTWEGSAARVTLTTLQEDHPARWSPDFKRQSREWVAEFLASRYPQRWPMQPDSFGVMRSVDQLRSWVAEVANVYNAGGVVCVAHTPGGLLKVGNLLAVAIAKPGEKAREAEVVVHSSGGYGSDKVDPALFERLKAECYRRDQMVLGHAELVRKWVAF